jgi:hypothetical protein
MTSRVRGAAIVGAALASFGAAAAPAYATFHLEKVNEVMLASATGDSGVRFVELLDLGGTEEAFTPLFAPYRLVVYDGAGTELGEQTLSPSGLRSAAGTGSPYLISTSAADAAFGVKGDEALSVAFPPAAGQLCFQGSPGAVSCMTWGPITKPVPMNSNGTGAVHGPVPPPGESDQRQANGTVVAAAPTPKAANRSASGSTTSPAAFSGVTFAARTATVDSHGRALVRMSCPAEAQGSCTGSLKLRKAHSRAVIARTSFSIAAGKTVTVRAHLSRDAFAAFKRAHRMRVTATAVSSDGSGASKTTTASLTLVRRHKTAPPPSTGYPSY